MTFGRVVHGSGVNHESSGELWEGHSTDYSIHDQRDRKSRARSRRAVSSFCLVVVAAYRLDLSEHTPATGPFRDKALMGVKRHLSWLSGAGVVAE